MYCNRCGKKIESNSKFCKYCGTCIVEDGVQEINGLNKNLFPALDARQELLSNFEDYDLDEEKSPLEMEHKTLLCSNTANQLILIRLLLFVSLLAFFGPFVQYIIFDGVGINGIEFIIAQSIQGTVDFENDPINIFLILSLVVEIVNLVTTFIDPDILECKFISINTFLALVGLITFRATMSFYYQISEYEMSLTKIGWGWWLSVILCITVLVIPFITKVGTE